ncbi:hypothetical protein [Streptomyces indiaensis]|uniref:Uncharacterized protein n=1 Tax=Streptomyces indiaensis TaxID=284033 RepID=A0ABP6HDV4_9ACTN|nr:hypothetical protein [Streptomyces indiaensis]MCF1647033.1 hypothetical protein [Streptomyces indiaensis]
MPADSTPDSAPENAAQQPAAEPSEAPLALSSKEHGLPETEALGESGDGDGGLATPMDTLDLHHGVFPLHDDAVFDSGSLPAVVDSASFVSGMSDFLKPLAVVGRFDEQEQAVLRVRAEKHPMPWTKAPASVQQDEAQGEHDRRKLKRVAEEWRRREIICRELP